MNEPTGGPVAGDGNVDRRNELAVDRTVLAAERTFGAWIRTGLAALAGGAGAHSLIGGMVAAGLVRTVESVLMTCAVLCFAAGAWREILAEGVWRSSEVRRIPPALLVLASAALIAITLALLVAVWMRG